MFSHLLRWRSPAWANEIPLASYRNSTNQKNDLYFPFVMWRVRHGQVSLFSLGGKIINYIHFWIYILTFVHTKSLSLTHKNVIYSNVVILNIKKNPFPLFGSIFSKLQPHHINKQKLLAAWKETLWLNSWRCVKFS